MRTVVLHVVGRASAGAESVRWLALESLLDHRVVVSMWTLVAAWSHVLQTLNPIGHGALPFAKERPCLALLRLSSRRGLKISLRAKRGNHKTTRWFLEQVDGNR